MKNREYPLLKKTVRYLLISLFILVLLVLFALAVVMLRPETKENTETQALQPPAPAMNISSSEELPAMLREFPSAVLGFLVGTGTKLTDGSSYDTAFEDGFARIVSLNYQTDSGIKINCQSIYPARALSLLSADGWALTGNTTAIAGMTAVRMENGSSIRLHVSGKDALYVLTLPKTDKDQFSQIVRNLQLLIIADESAN